MADHNALVSAAGTETGPRIGEARRLDKLAYAMLTSGGSD